MEIRSCTVYGRVWHTVDRPGSLSECDNRFTVSSMQQASRDVAQDRYKSASPAPTLDEDRSWHDGRNPGRKGFTAYPQDAGPAMFVGGGARGHLSAGYPQIARTMSFPNLRESEGTPSRASSPSPLRSEQAAGAVGRPGGTGDARHEIGLEQRAGLDGREMSRGESAAQGQDGFVGASSGLSPPHKQSAAGARPAAEAGAASANTLAAGGADDGGGRAEGRRGDGLRAARGKDAGRLQTGRGSAHTGSPAQKSSRLTIRPKSPLAQRVIRRSHSTSSLTDMGNKDPTLLESAGRRRQHRRQHTSLLSERYSSRSASLDQARGRVRWP
jgi:hypothetical protein